MHNKITSEKDAKPNNLQSEIPATDELADNKTGKMHVPFTDRQKQMTIKEKKGGGLNPEPEASDTKRKGVIGTDGNPISIKKEGDTYVIKGNPDADTRKIFEALLKTPKGVETAIEYTTGNYEFRFRLVEVIYDEKNEKVHGETYEAGADNNNCSNNPELFDHFNVDISLATTSDEDRMKGWSDEMKLNVITSHEKGHVKSGLLQDEEHKQGITYLREMESAFQYNILYQNNSALSEPWLQNYNTNEDIGYKMVNKAYREAVEGLVKAGKLEKAKGNTMVDDFIKGNVPK